jgi:hypothetical protein
MLPAAGGFEALAPTARGLLMMFLQEAMWRSLAVWEKRRLQ